MPDKRVNPTCPVIRLIGSWTGFYQLSQTIGIPSMFAGHSDLMNASTAAWASAKSVTFCSAGTVGAILNPARASKMEIPVGGSKCRTRSGDYLLLVR